MKPQAWDFYFLTNNLIAVSIEIRDNLNKDVAQKKNAAAFLIQYCWEWYDGKFDKKHRICPEDIQVQFTSVGANNCANPTFNNIPATSSSLSSTEVSNLSSLPLPPSICCESNCSNILNATQSRPMGVFQTTNSLVGTPLLQGTCVAWPFRPINQGTFESTLTNSVQETGEVLSSLLIQVCLNTTSDCLYVKTPTTQNQYSRFTCTSSKGEKKCIYSIGSSSGRCETPSIAGQPKSSNGSITLIKPDYSPMSTPNCNDETTYTYFSGALAGTQGTIISQCNDGSPNNCGQPQALGFFGNCGLTIKQVCPCYQELGYQGQGTDLIFSRQVSLPFSDVGFSSALRVEYASAGSGGLSFPYTYMCLTWREKNGGCCPIDKVW